MASEQEFKRASAIASRGSVVHSHCGAEIARILGKPRKGMGVNTVGYGVCTWCGEPGYVSTVLDYYDSGYFD